MANRAEWRPWRHDPRTGLGWALRDLGGPVRLVGQQSSWAIRFLGLVGLLQGSFVGFCFAFVFAWAPEVVANGLAEMRGPEWLWGFSPKPLRVDDLVTLPPPATPFPCAVEVSKKGTMLGRDVGIVTFVDGWLHFEGRRTSFALRRSDAASRGGDLMRLAEGGEVRFAPGDSLAVGELRERDLAKRFRANLASWMRSDPPEGEALLPPVLAHPSGTARAWSNLLASLVAGGSLGSFVLWMSGPFWALAFAVPFLIGALRAVFDLLRVRRLR